MRNLYLQNYLYITSFSHYFPNRLHHKGAKGCFDHTVRQIVAKIDTTLQGSSCTRLGGARQSGTGEGS